MILYISVGFLHRIELLSTETQSLVHDTFGFFLIYVCSISV